MASSETTAKEQIETTDVFKLRSEYWKLYNTNKDVLDSISCAAIIQQGMLPNHIYFERAFKEYFVIYWPQQIIGGDFYWITEKGDWSILAVADCMGHGVSGAMLSVLGINVLNYVVLANKQEQIENVLEQVDKKWCETFNKPLEQGIDIDWMEVSLVAFNRKTRELNFAGAKGKITIVNQKGIKVVKGNNYPIGGWQIETLPVFNVHKMIIPENSMIYLSSDGFQDQFGSVKNKKFSNRRLLEYLSDIHHLPASVQKTFLSFVFDEWKGNNIQTDDVCLIGLRV